MHTQAHKSTRDSDWYNSQDALLAELKASVAPPARLAEVRGYRDLRELRRGGQGIVYTATQVSTKRRVAIKVLLETGRTTAETRRRFEREIDIVAGLSHPGIVQVYDSGTTDDGRLFCVMEYIEGAGIDELLLGGDRTLGPIDNTLRLFAKICDAVQFAHQRGVIHRDIKPSNIRIDTTGEPHVLDFGLAKAIDDRFAPHSQMSMTGQFMGSLPWASPEQAEGQSNKVDVRTDVYSLGVLLHQILTGTFPYDVTGALPQVLENIRFTQPSSPRSRRSEISEELATIVLKCLSKEPDRRYQSAGELARDVRHYLAGEPIEAKRDSAWYAIRKTMTRYRTTMRVIAGFLVISIAATVWMALLWQRAIAAERLAADRLSTVEAARQAEKLAHEATAAEADRAKRTVAFLDATLRFVDPWKHPGRDITPMREMLDAALARLDDAFADQPIVQASLANTLGYDYWTLGLFDVAETTLRRAYEQSLKHLGEEDEQTLAAQFDLGSLLTERGKHTEAEAIFRQMLEVQCRVHGPDDRRTLNTMNNLGYDIDWQGRVPEAAEFYRAAYAGLCRVIGPHSVDTMHSANNLAIALQTLGEPAEAERLLAEVVDGRWMALGPHHPETLQAQMNLAKMVGDNGRLVESLALLQRVVDDIDATLEPGHPLALAAKGNLADTMGYLGRREDALRMNQETYELQVAFGGHDNPTALLRLNQVMCSMIDLHQYEPAVEIGRQLRKDLARVLGPGDMRTLIMSGNLAYVLNELKQSDEAVAIWHDLIRDGIAALGEDAQPVCTARANLAGYFADQGRWTEAEQSYRLALGTLEKAQQLSTWRAAVMLGGLGRVLTETGRYDEAEVKLNQAYAIMHETFGNEHERTQRIIALLIALHDRAGHSEKAAEFRAKQIAASEPAPA